MLSEEQAGEACEAACATSWRQRSMRCDLEGGLLLMVVAGCHCCEMRVRCGRAMLEGIVGGVMDWEWEWFDREGMFNQTA